MAGPWEQYQQTEVGPWAKYQSVAPVKSAKDMLAESSAKAAEASTGLTEQARTMASGMGAQIIAGFAGLGQAAKNVVSPGMSAADRVRQVQNALTYAPRTEAGAEVENRLAPILGALPTFAEEMGQKVSNVAGPMAGTATNVAIQAAPAVLGKFGKPIIEKAYAKAAATAAKDTALAVPKTEALAAAREAGYVVPPAEVNPSVANRMVEGLAGQYKLQQLASAKNQPVTNGIVRAALGIPEDVPLSIDSLSAVRKSAGNAYDKVRGAGTVTVDQAYAADLSAIESKYVGASKSFPKLVKNEVKNAVDAVKVNEFDASSAIDAIKINREAADTAFRTGDSGLGVAHKSIADAIEGQLDRHLQQYGHQMPQGVLSLEEFRNAREQIAQTYEVQRALKGNDVDARMLGKSYEKGRLTGYLATAGQFGSHFKGAAQTGSKNAYTPGWWETVGMGGVGGAGALAGGLSGEAGVPLSMLAMGTIRPALRGAITTSPYQNMLVNAPSYAPGKFVSGMNALVSNPYTLNALSAMPKPQGQ
jgi:hypothetical protein